MKEGGSSIGKVLGFVVIVGLVVGMKFYNQSQSAAEVKEAMHGIIVQLPKYDSEKNYYESLFSEAHDKAFSASYRMGGRRQSAKFDEKQYLNVLFDSMIAHASSDGKREVASDIEVGKAVMLAAVDTPQQ